MPGTDRPPIESRRDGRILGDLQPLLQDSNSLRPAPGTGLGFGTNRAGLKIDMRPRANSANLGIGRFHADQANVVGELSIRGETLHPLDQFVE